MLEAAGSLLEQVRADFDAQAFHRALERIWQVVGEANRYFTAQEPWKLRKTDVERMNTVLYVTAEVLRIVAILTQPVMPASMGKLLDLLSVAPENRVFAHLGQSLVAGVALPAPAPIFPRYEEPKEA